MRLLLLNLLKLHVGNMLKLLVVKCVERLILPQFFSRW